MAKVNSFFVKKDSREQKGWDFEAEEKSPGKIQCLGTVVECLQAADYSIVGYEDLVRIERKNGFCELFGNMSPKENKLRFEREMEKLRVIPHKYIIVETNLSLDTLSLGMPQSFRPVPSSVVYKWLLELEMEYGVKVIFAGNCGQKICRYIFESVLKKV